MGKLESDTFVCIDCETTGLDTEKDQIIEIAVVTFQIEKNLDSFESLVDPLIPIPQESIAIHHISEEMVKGKPEVSTVLPKVLELVGKHPIVGHGVEFDIKMVANACKQHKINTMILSNPVIDTLRLARLYGESSINSLEALRCHFNIENEGAHRAMSDVLVNIQVFKQLIKNFKTTEQIMKALSKPIALKAMPLGKHKGRPFKEIPLNYLRWAAKMDFDQDLLFSIRSELKRRKSGGGFSQASSPFANL